MSKVIRLETEEEPRGFFDMRLENAEGLQTRSRRRPSGLRLVEVRRFPAEIEEGHLDFEELCGVLLVFKVLTNLSYIEMENRGGSSEHP